MALKSLIAVGATAAIIGIPAAAVAGGFDVAAPANPGRQATLIEKTQGQAIEHDWDTMTGLMSTESWDEMSQFMDEYGMDHDMAGFMEEHWEEMRPFMDDHQGEMHGVDGMMGYQSRGSMGRGMMGGQP